MMSSGFSYSASSLSITFGSIAIRSPCSISEDRLHKMIYTLLLYLFLPRFISVSAPQPFPSTFPTPFELTLTRRRRSRRRRQQSPPPSPLPAAQPHQAVQEI